MNFLSANNKKMYNIGTCTLDICGKGWTIRYLMGKCVNFWCSIFFCTHSSMQDFFLKTFKLHQYKS